MSARRYAIIIERGPTSYGAYSPDVPGCAVVGGSDAEVRRLIAEAISSAWKACALAASPFPNQVPPSITSKWPLNR